MIRESFEGLQCWKKARIIRMNISALAKTFPDRERYLLTQQIIKSSRSVTANIAEGWGRFNFKENVQFCRIARGSLIETVEHLITAYDEHYITEEQLEILKNEVTECTRILNGYINFLKKPDSKSHSEA